MLLDCLEAFYGGAAGGGKSVALLMCGLQYVDVPGYNGLILRNTYKNLIKPSGILDLAHSWLINTDAKWDDKASCYRFPNFVTGGYEGGATLSFGYMDGPKDHWQFQGPEFQFVGLDELVQLREFQAVYLFSRMRRLEEYMHIPLRYRVASNPPSRDQIARGEWVKRRYVDPKTREPGAIYIPARMDDNPYLDKITYRQSLSKLDPVTRRQLRDGDWEVRAQGNMFDRSWFPVLRELPKDIIASVRYWDLAATEPSKEGKDPDYTSSCKMHLNKRGMFIIEHMHRFRKSPGSQEDMIRQSAELDGKRCKVVIEQEPGASAKILIDDIVRKALAGWKACGRKVSKSKFHRAGPLSTMAEACNVYVMPGTWNDPFFDEIEVFPDGEHDDMTDTASGAYSELALKATGRVALC